MTSPITLAVSKGRILKPTVELFGRAGFDLSPVLGSSRSLFHDCGPLRVFVVRGTDVPTYVAHGAADLGVAGRDAIDESGLDLYTPVDTGLGKCRLVLAGRKDHKLSPGHLRIATKYPRLARRFAHTRGFSAHIVKLSGAIELSPLVGLADRVVDLVETGSTLRENGLEEIETVLEVTTQLIASPARLKLLGEPVRSVIDAVSAAVARPE